MRVVSSQWSVVSKSAFCLALCAMLFALCAAAQAQQLQKIPRIGFLFVSALSSNTARIDAFRRGLRELGYSEGKNIAIEWRSAEGRPDRVPALAIELTRLNLDLIVTAGPAATGPAKEATGAIPIVMAQDTDPVGNGFVATLARPGGNITGLSTLSPELSGKQLEILKEIVPKLSRMAVLGISTRPGTAQALREMELAAAAFKVQLHYLDILELRDIEPAFRAASKERVNAVVILGNPIATTHRSQIIELTLKNRLPAMYDRPEFVEDGGLMTYAEGSKTCGEPCRTIENPKSKIPLIPPKALIRADKTDSMKVASGQWSARASSAIALCAMLFAICFSAEAQQPAKKYRIGILSNAASPAGAMEYQQALHELGYIEGQNLVIEWRFTKGKTDRFPSLAAELVSLKVDIIVGIGVLATRAAKRATSTIPIVMGNADDDPVRQGLVASLARPGGNVTGFTNIGSELAGKRLELLREIAPNASRMAILFDPSSPPGTANFRESEVAARALRLQLQPVEVRSSEDLENAFRTATKARAEALIIIHTGAMNPNRVRSVNLALKTGLPAIYSSNAWVREGGLMGYEGDADERIRGVATYVDRILKGTKPADLPVQQPSKFEFVINLKAAKQIRLTIPPNVLARADQVIR